MAGDGTVQGYLDLSREYLAAAEASLQVGAVAPAYHNALHALELGVKAALATRLAEVPQTHNVAGLFGREFRDPLGADTCSRISVLLHQYDAPRYPDWDMPEDAEGDIAFIADLVRHTIPSAIGGPR